MNPASDRKATNMITGPEIFELVMAKMENTDIHHRVVKALKRFHEKKPSAWMAKAVEKELPGCSVRFDRGRDAWERTYLRVNTFTYSLGPRNLAFDWLTFRDDTNERARVADEANEALNEYIVENNCAALVELINEANAVTARLSVALRKCPVKWDVRNHVDNPDLSDG